MPPNAVVLKQHTEEEWAAVKPIIEHLYLHQRRPLFSVMQTMETNHRFKASIAMYKRKLRTWGTRKNMRHGARAVTAAAAGRPRYLPQNDVDESLHTLLDLMPPWISQSALLWQTSLRIGQPSCPPRAAYIYDDFAQGVAIAAAAFESGDTVYGGTLLRQAFIDLEHTLAPDGRSTFTLHSLFFSLATLNQAGLFKASRLLVAHATSWVAALPHGKYARLEPGSQLDEEPKRIDKHWNASHPFPLILGQLQRLAMHLRGDNATMMKAVLLAWSAYHQEYSTAQAKTVAPKFSQKEFWNRVMKTQKFLAYGGTTGWIDAMQPVLHILTSLQSHIEDHIGIDDDINFVVLDEIVSIYGLARHENFEETALMLQARVESKARDNVVDWVRWSLANFELAAYYKDMGDVEKLIKHFSRVMSGTLDLNWEAIVRDEFECWLGGRI